jgi:spore coat polysaccharide biosynthesis protein SpsF
MLAAIIQARIASNRLPGKVLKEVLGRPILLYQLEQLKGVSQIEQIIVATTTSRKDDPIVELCKRESVAYFRGSEDDVLKRFYQTALHYKVDTIVRLTADCPLIDPAAVKMAIESFVNGQYDYVYLGPTFAEGICCDIFSFRALEIAYTRAELESEREHVTPFIHHHPELFKIKALENKTDDSKYRFVVDRAEDFEVVKAIIESLYCENSGPLQANEIKQFLDNNPSIFQKNAHIIRNEDYNVFE